MSTQGITKESNGTKLTMEMLEFMELYLNAPKEVQNKIEELLNKFENEGATK